MEKNKTGKYFKYAIGEIILVVIGILIALSINNWQQDRLHVKLENRYLTDLVNDLKQDSTTLQKLYSEALLTAIAKDSLYKVIDQPDYKLDSLPYYFLRQWVGYRIFSPSTSTIEEMKSSSQLEIIRDDILRKNIVNMYYQYELFQQDEDLFTRTNREIFIIAKNELNNIDQPSEDEIKKLLRDRRLTNRIRKNFAKGRLQSVLNISTECNGLLLKLREHLEKGNDHD